MRASQDGMGHPLSVTLGMTQHFGSPRKRRPVSAIGKVLVEDGGPRATRNTWLTGSEATVNVDLMVVWRLKFSREKAMECLNVLLANGATARSYVI